MKITDLIIHRAFCQANLIKGYQYLDDAGKIMCKYDDRLPEWRVGVEGLIMRNPQKGGGDALKQLSVNVQRIWLAFHEPATVNYVLNHATSILLDISEIIHVQAYSRLGVRFQFLYKVDDFARALHDFSHTVLDFSKINWDQIGEIQGLTVQSRHAVGDTLAATINLSPVLRREAKAEEITRDKLPQYAMMIDVDTFTSGEFRVERAVLRKFFRQVQEFLQGPLPTFLTPILEGGTHD